jgi:hypothetical protein
MAVQRTRIDHWHGRDSFINRSDAQHQSCRALREGAGSPFLEENRTRKTMVRIRAYHGFRPANRGLRIALFRFLSGVEKRRRVAATNMNCHFIDGFARSLDIGRTAPQASSAHPVSGRSFAAF